MYIWIIVTLFPGPSVDDIGFKELQILYAMVNKIRFSPVKWLVPFWISSIAPSMPLCFTSPITRIAKSMGLLETNEVEYIQDDRPLFGEQMFRSANLIKRDPRNGLKMIYGNHPIEVSLPDEDLWLYNASSLTLTLGRENRANPLAGTDRMMRARSCAVQQQASPSYAAPQEEDEVNSMETPHHSRTSSAAHTPRPRPKWRHSSAIWRASTSNSRPPCSSCKRTWTWPKASKLRVSIDGTSGLGINHPSEQEGKLGGDSLPH